MRGTSVMCAPGQDRDPDRVGVLLEHRGDDLLRRLVQAGVDHLHARVAQRPRDDLCSPVVPIQARLGDDDTDGPTHSGASVSALTPRGVRTPRARVRSLVIGVEAVLDVRRDEHDRARADRPVVLLHADPAPAGDHVVELVLAVRGLRILLAGAQHVEARRSSSRGAGTRGTARSGPSAPPRPRRSRRSPSAPILCGTWRKGETRPGPAEARSHPPERPRRQTLARRNVPRRAPGSRGARVGRISSGNPSAGSTGDPRSKDGRSPR